MAREELTIRRKFDEQYRMACPRGHVSLFPAETTPTAYCKTCGQSYAFEELRDRQRTSRS